MITCGVISKKKKNRSTHVWLQDLCSFRPENYTKCVSEQVLTFFFFFLEITPVSYFLEPRGLPPQSSLELNLSVPILL